MRAVNLGFEINAEEATNKQSKLLFEKSDGNFDQTHAVTQTAIKELTKNNDNLTNNVATSITALQHQMNAM